MKGMITDIQRYSLYDGPGIRTTVFLKGCNMRCLWCHNPETLSAKRQLHIYGEKCIGCGHCVQACESGARRMENGALVYDPRLCTVCGACADVCFSGALQMSGRLMQPQQVIDEVMQDKEYYDRSGGGITLSGGEVFCQPDFLREVLLLAREQGIHTAVETNLNYSREMLEEFLPLLDLVLFDIKTLDEEEHMRWTGVSNRRIVENARFLLESDTPCIVHTPVIPGATDKVEVIEAIAAFIKDSHSLLYYELLNYNPLGEGKYISLGMDYRFHGARPLPVSGMEGLAQAARAYGIPVRTR